MPANQQLEIRKATIEDANYIWQIANNPKVRSFFISKETFSFESHLEWMTGFLSKSDRVMWIAFKENQLVGYCRYEKTDSISMDIHFAVNPEYWGQGIGSYLIKHTIPYAQKHLSTHKVQGKALLNNLASAKTFLKLGFKTKGTENVGNDTLQLFEKEV